MKAEREVEGGKEKLGETKRQALRAVVGNVVAHP